MHCSIIQYTVNNSKKSPLYRNIYHGNVHVYSHSHIELPNIGDTSVVPPPYIVRALLLYGRSHCVPTYSNKQVSDNMIHR